MEFNLCHGSFVLCHWLLFQLLWELFIQPWQQHVPAVQPKPETENLKQTQNFFLSPN
jgi:hypothetical protein